ncbi:MAG: hypothetical protein ACODAE_06930 [Gemmatimonadota bacterium]
MKGRHDLLPLAHALRVLAAVEAERGRTLRAVRLAGAGSGLAEWSQAVYPYAIATEDEHREAIAELERSAGEDAFVVEWAAGRSLSLEEAVAFALDAPRRDGPSVPAPDAHGSARSRVFGLGQTEVCRGGRRLRTALYHLRRALGGTERVRYEDGRYGFDRGLDRWFDVEAFESAIEQAERRIERDPRAAATAIEQTLELRSRVEDGREV